MYDPAAFNPSQISVLTWQRYQVEVFNKDLNDWAVRMRQSAPA